MARIHITGPSGCGATTLGIALSERLDCAHFDADAYYWLPTDPPFRHKRPVTERVALLRADIGDLDAWVLTGSVGSWGAEFVPRFTLVVYLWVPTEQRLERLVKRERERYGAAIAPGGRMHEAHVAFLEWAAGYDDGTVEGRTRARHEAWMATLPCPILRMDKDETVGQRVARVLRAIEE